MSILCEFSTKRQRMFVGNLCSMLNPTYKHLLHCMLFFTVISIFLNNRTSGSTNTFDPWTEYGLIPTCLLYLLRSLPFLVVPQILFNFCGLVFYNAFPGKVVLKGSPLLAPFICIRVVTRGDFPHLVQNNVIRNINTCLDVGLENFLIEVVTDKPINLQKHPVHGGVREIVVPSDYRTKTGALYKSRALQYCLEDSVNVLNSNDWIVHLDEETLLTEDSVRGIINFVLDGKHSFGQGLITYANEKIVNLYTTLADTFRVADDMGKLRFQFKCFHKPLFSWKGSYVVCQYQAEKQVSFDNGLDGSVAEDCFFGMRAFSEGYTFDFIEGEMWEKSPFTLLDYVQQRKRWLVGILLVVHSKMIPLKYKLVLMSSIYAWATMPLATVNMILSARYPLPQSEITDFICAFMFAIYIYMYIFGVLKSFSVNRLGYVRFAFCLIAVVCIIPVNIVVENSAVIWGLLGKKYKFHIVEKDTNWVTV